MYNLAAARDGAIRRAAPEQPVTNLWYLKRIKVFSGPKNVVISSKKYDIHK
jgi:hypothetical protein